MLDDEEIQNLNIVKDEVRTPSEAWAFAILL